MVLKSRSMPLSSSMVCLLLPAHDRNYSSDKSNQTPVFLDRAGVAIDSIGTKLLDRFTHFVHILNSAIIYPYKSWICRVNETFYSSVSSTEMAGPLSGHLPSNLVSHSA